jgi:hypothetical protein
MRVGCVLMQKDEVNALEPWLLYHAHLFGMENLCVIDHGSTHPRVVSTLSWYEEEGLKVVRLPTEANFALQGEFMTNEMQEMDAAKGYDFLLPIDCDEFLALRREDGGFTCEREEILACLAAYAGQPETLEIKQNLLNILGHPGLFWALPYQKVFFSGGNLGRLCHGSHEDVSGRGAGKLETPLIYVHFHHKSWDEQVKASKEKLRHFVDVDDPKALAEFKGLGWHLLLHLRAGEAAYRELMKVAPSGPPVREVDGLMALFDVLGIDPLFSERPVP